MKRIDKIYDYIFQNSKNFNKDTLLEQKGFNSQEIGNALGLLRNNVSKELNTLCREKKIIKIKHRPVLYFDRKCFEDILSIRLPKDLEELSNINSLICNPKVTNENESPFTYLIGANSSLKDQIEQAKAALMYPPAGLHTLIVGDTGVGKSLFANIMYEYSKYKKRLPKEAPFVVFNCADYASNPQLLLSYIFGHIKGAFTGAEKEKDGIISKADGGILFLDEVHRLPPEGQEMIFYFMDTGTYNKLGETDRIHKADVLLIGATTEDPNSTLLKTFIRRIPITITIPNFDERPISEQIQLIHFLISKEAQRVNKTIKISGEAIKALIGSTSYGNVGQLKSNIQLACAKGYLNCINTDECIDINLELLTPNTKDKIITFRNKVTDNATAWNVMPDVITISPYDTKTFLETDAYELPFNIYDIIKNKTSILEEEGMSKDNIKNLTSIQIQESSPKERVGVVVVTHGSSIATNMVAVAKSFFYANNILAVDMPLEMKPSDILETVIERVIIVNEGKGVLLLVDMEYLNDFADIITKKTNIITKSVDMVSTPLIVEAIRKCSVCDTDLNSIHSYLITDFKV